MIALLLKASLIIIILLAFYKTVLEKESFFGINRLYLLSCLVLACTLPFISLPQLIDHQGYLTSLFETSSTEELSEESKEFNPVPPQDFPQEDKSIDQEKTFDNNMVALDELKKSEQGLIKEEESKTVAPIIDINKLSLQQWFLLVYLFGVVILSLNLIAQVISTLLKAIKNEDKIVDNDGIIVNMSAVMEPCSFFKYIFINPASYEYETYEQIIAHEKIHVKKWHTLDLLITELAVIIFWFNPFIWMFRKEVEKNIEYQTDDLLIQEKAEQKVPYQMSLLKIATYNKPLAITTNYNQSLIKQRILKMNSKKSNPYSYWKYTFIVPLIFTILLVINKPINVAAQTMEEIASKTMEDKPNKIENLGLTQVQKEKNTSSISSIPVEEETTEQIEQANLSEENTSDDTLDLQEDDLSMALMLAIDQRQIETISLLIKNGADVNKKVFEGWTPLMEAVDENHIDIIELLIENEVKINAKDDSGRTALFKAVDQTNLEIVSLLIKHGADVNVQDNQGRTPLMEAVTTGHLDLVIYLVQNGAEIDAKANQSQTAIMIAIDKNKQQIVNYLLSLSGEKDKDIDAEDQVDNNTEQNEENSVNNESLTDCQLLLKAVINNDIEEVKNLLKSVDPNCVFYREDFTYGGRDDSRTPLVAAARRGYLELGKILVDAGAKINFHARGDETPLMAASAYGNLDFVKYLVGKGASINKKVSGDGTALLVASGRGQTEVVSYLIQQKADVNASVSGDGTPLICAVREGHLEVAKVLLENGADPYKNVPGDEYAMYHARVNGDQKMIQLLKKYEK